MQKQEYDQKIEETKKSLISAIKELDEFSKNFSSGMSN